MKELILIRHGKSSWEYDVSDKDRPLTERGIQDGHLVAQALGKEFPTPDAIYSSPANRALHTCCILMRELGLPLDRLRLEEGLYDFSGASVKAFVRGLDNSLGRVMIFGHNHAFTLVANAWGSRHTDNVPTTGCVHLAFDTDSWSGIRHGRTVKMVFPKQLK